MAERKLFGLTRKAPEKQNFHGKLGADVLQSLRDLESRAEQAGFEVARSEIAEEFLRGVARDLGAWLDKPDDSCSVIGIERRDETENVQLKISEEVLAELKTAEERLGKDFGAQYSLNRRTVLDEAFRRYVRTAGAMLDKAGAAARDSAEGA